MATPAWTSDNVAGVVHAGVVDTNNANARSALAIDEVPVAVTVKVYDPAVIGVPVKAPPLESESPVGRVDPDFTT